MAPILLIQFLILKFDHFDVSLDQDRDFKNKTYLVGRMTSSNSFQSGDPSPSAEDIRITRQLIQAGKVIGINILDHVVLGRTSAERAKDFVSMRETGLVEFE